MLCRDVQAGRVGAAEVHMFKFKPNPRRMHELLRKTIFQRKISCVVVRLLKQRAFFLCSGVRCMYCKRRCSWKQQNKTKKTPHQSVHVSKTRKYRREGVARTFTRTEGKVCELWQQCECHCGVTVAEESHSTEGFNIAEVVLTPWWETSN